MNTSAEQQEPNLYNIKLKHHDAEIFFPAPDPKLSAAESIDNMISQIEGNFTLDFGGYQEKKYLAVDLLRKIFEGRESGEIFNLSEKQEEITEILSKELDKVGDFMALNKSVQIYVFPLGHKKHSKLMNGANAFALGSTSLYFFIDIQNPQWKRGLRNLVSHEYTHLLSFSFVKARTILDAVVFEGLAEHTREHVIGGAPAKWSLGISKERALEDLQELPTDVTDLSMTHENYHPQISYLFGNDEIPKWYGYSMGYWLVGEVLHKTDSTLPELIKMQPTDVLALFLEFMRGGK